jgi:hypothetical protein
MSLIRLAAHLIRRASEDDGYAQDLGEAVAADQRAFNDLVNEVVNPADLDVMTPSRWQWFAGWRQAQGGQLDAVVVDYLAHVAFTRYARYEVRALVLRDPLTNNLARGDGDHTSRFDNVGLNWLRTQAQITSNPLELTRDALQCATEASWFVLRQLASLQDERGVFVQQELDRFAEQRGITPEITRLWRFQQ